MCGSHLTHEESEARPVCLVTYTTLGSGFRLNDFCTHSVLCSSVPLLLGLVHLFMHPRLFPRTALNISTLP